MATQNSKQQRILHKMNVYSWTKKWKKIALIWLEKEWTVDARNMLMVRRAKGAAAGSQNKNLFLCSLKCSWEQF